MSTAQEPCPKDNPLFSMEICPEEKAWLFQKDSRSLVVALKNMKAKHAVILFAPDNALSHNCKLCFAQLKPAANVA